MCYYQYDIFLYMKQKNTTIFFQRPSSSSSPVMGSYRVCSNESNRFMYIFP